MSDQPDFWFNIWNLGNHENEICANDSGQTISYRLDSGWRVKFYPSTSPHPTALLINAAVDMAGWLNRNGYKPTGKRP